MLIARGRTAADFRVEKVHEPGMYADLAQAKLKLVRDRHSLDSSDRSLCLLSNTAENTKIMSHISERAHAMFQSKAYLHHYAKYGLGEKEIVEYLTIFESVIDSYRAV